MLVKEAVVLIFMLLDALLSMLEFLVLYVLRTLLEFTVIVVTRSPAEAGTYPQGGLAMECSQEAVGPPEVDSVRLALKLSSFPS